MIKGMTGFGSSRFQAGKIRGIFEIKSLNHRYFDLSCYLPGGCSSFEDKIRQIVQKSVERGKITASLKILEKPTVSINFNRDAVKTYLKYVHSLSKDFGLKNDLSAADLLKFPGVVESKEITLDQETLWPFAEKSLQGALKGFMGMRLREGRSLAKELNDLLRRMVQQTKEIQKRAKVILKAKKSAVPAEEFSAFQKGTDVNEEITRLKHYIDEFRQLLNTNAAVGKKLDFIAQEMQRETNTIGSKLQDKIVSNGVIALKSKIEKIRELANNVE